MASSTKPQSDTSCTSPQEAFSSSKMSIPTNRLENVHTILEGTATRCESLSVMDESRLQFCMPNPESGAMNSNSFCDVGRKTLAPNNSSFFAEDKLMENSTTVAKPVELSADHSNIPFSKEMSSLDAEFQDKESNGLSVSVHSSRNSEETAVCDLNENVANDVAESESSAKNEIINQYDKSQNNLDTGVDKEDDKLEESAKSEIDEHSSQCSQSNESEHADETGGKDVSEAAAIQEDSNVIEENGSANIVGEQHSLTGPHRRHHMARRQRIHDANATAARRTISLPESLRAQWREIGAQWGLEDDNAIANVLLRHYEDLMAGRPPRPPPRRRCRDCGEALVPAPCLNCGPNHHSNRLAHHRHDSDPGSGRSNFCGRCRD